MPPEQVLNFRTARPAADQYSAAATLSTLLSGQHIYDPAATVQEQLKQILEKEPVPLAERLPHAPPELMRAVRRALSRRPEDRFADASTFREALTPFASA
jgi:serine/threonine-protein kinase